MDIEDGHPTPDDTPDAAPDAHKGRHYISTSPAPRPWACQRGWGGWARSNVVTPLVGVRGRGVTLLVLLIMLVACSSMPVQPVRRYSSPLLGPYGSTSSAARAPAGRIVFADRQFPDAVNPLFSGSPVDFEVGAALWSAPVVFDNHFHIQPDQLTEVPLPENGDVQDNGKTIVMRLRHDLRWSDGQPILARDFQYWRPPDQDPNTGAITTGGYAAIASIATPDDFTVILYLNHPYS